MYLSLGSLGSADVELMRRLVAVLADTPHRYVVSKGPRADEFELPDNMWGEARVPQTNVIPHCDLVITHGGNNTTTEAFHFGKPMIVLPLFWDQYDNAQRVDELGLGVRLDTYAFEDDELRRRGRPPGRRPDLRSTGGGARGRDPVGRRDRARRGPDRGRGAQRLGAADRSSVLRSEAALGVTNTRRYRRTASGAATPMIAAIRGHDRMYGHPHYGHEQANPRQRGLEAARPLLFETAKHRQRVFADGGLTPNDARALFVLDRTRGRSMSELADEWLCDASNATWIVDRLEERGLAERRTIPTDRRVKLVVLTAKGDRTRHEMIRTLYEPPPELLELDLEDLEALRDAVAKLPLNGAS